MKEASARILDFKIQPGSVVKNAIPGPPVGNRTRDLANLELSYESRCWELGNEGCICNDVNRNLRKHYGNVYETMF